MVTVIRIALGALIVMLGSIFAGEAAANGNPAALVIVGIVFGASAAFAVFLVFAGAFKTKHTHTHNHLTVNMVQREPRTTVEVSNAKELIASEPSQNNRVSWS